MATTSLENIRLVLCSKTAAEWATNTTVILRGEFAIEIDTMKVKIGNGVDIYKNLPYLTLTPGEINNIIAQTSHYHDNKEILDLTTASFTSELLAKLNGIAEGANKTIVDSALSATSTNPLQNKIIKQELDKKVPTTRKVNGHALSADVTITAEDTGAIPVTEKGAAGGVATLDETGRIPSHMLPDGVDEIIDGYFYNNKFYKDSGHSTEIIGQGSKLYVNLEPGKDLHKVYRWSGSMFVVIPDNIIIGEEAGQAMDAIKGMMAFRHSQAAHAPSNAEKNVIIGIQKNGADITVGADRKVNIPVPTKTSELTNDSGFLTKSGTISSADKLTTPRPIDGVNFDGSEGISHYATCSTAAETAAKTAAISKFALSTGARVTIKFTATNTAANPTLNISSTGAKAIQYRGSAITAGTLAANRVYEFIYDGTNWQLVGDLDTDTKYTAGAGLKLTGNKFEHTNSIAAGTAKGDDTKALTYGGTFTIPTVNYDAQGHITGKGTTTMTMPAVPSNVASATKLQNKRKFSITGGATSGQVDFDGTGDVNLVVSKVDAAKLYLNPGDTLYLMVISKEEYIMSLVFNKDMNFQGTSQIETKKEGEMPITIMTMNASCYGGNVNIFKNVNSIEVYTENKDVADADFVEFENKIFQSINGVSEVTK